MTAEEQVNYSTDWLGNTITELNDLGFICIPYLENIDSTYKYADGEKYDLTAWNNDRVSKNKFGIRLDRYVLIDWDGYKPDTVSFQALAEKLGVNDDELITHCIQWNEDNNSFHFLFKLPDDVDIKDIKQANNGGWLKGVDVKTGNQLCYLKSNKRQRFDIPFATVPQVIIDETLKQHESNGDELGDVKRVDLELESALDLIDPSCDYDTWLSVITGTVSEYGNGKDVIDILDKWSSKGETYQNRAEVENKVLSFEREGGTTWGSVIHHAGGSEAVRDNLINLFKNVVLMPPPTFDPTKAKPVQASTAAVVSTFGYPDTKLTRTSRKALSTADNLRTLLKLMNYDVAINSMNLDMDVQHNGRVHQFSYDKLRSDLISAAEKTELPKVAIDEHLTAVAEDSSYHPIEAHFHGKQWDGVPRVQAVINAIPTDNVKVRDLVMRKWFISAIAAVYEKRFSTKLTPVLRGGQSAMKSAFISRIASIIPNSFLPESTLNPDDVDSVIRVCKHHIVELAELERTTKREAGALKAFLTAPEDNFRVKYGRKDTKKPRQTVFIATVNEAEFLKDTTGNSRFATIELTGPMDMDSVNSVLGYEWSNGRLKHAEPYKLDQFWLEVITAYNRGESWHLTEEEQRVIEQVNDKHVQKGIYYDAILEKIEVLAFGINTPTSITRMIGVPVSQVRTVGRDLKQLVEDGYLVVRRTSTQRIYNKA